MIAMDDVAPFDPEFDQRPAGEFTRQTCGEDHEAIPLKAPALSPAAPAG
jgi:hypothetical protein